MGGEDDELDLNYDDDGILSETHEQQQARADSVQPSGDGKAPRRGSARSHPKVEPTDAAEAAAKKQRERISWAAHKELTGGEAEEQPGRSRSRPVAAATAAGGTDPTDRSGLGRSSRGSRRASHKLEQRNSTRGGVRVENAPEGRRGDRSVNGYAEDMQLFSGPLPLLPPAFDLPPQGLGARGQALPMRSWIRAESLPEPRLSERSSWGFRPHHLDGPQDQEEPTSRYAMEMERARRLKPRGASAAALKAAERDARLNRGLPRLPLDSGWQAMEVDDLPLPPPPFPVQQPSPRGGEAPAPADTHTTSAANGTHHAHKAGERRHRGDCGGQDTVPQGDEQTTGPAPRPSKVSNTNLVPVTGSRLGSSTEAPTPAARAEPKATAASLAPSTGSVDVQRAVRAAVEAAAAADAAAVAARAAVEPGQQEAVDGVQAAQLQMLENYAKDVAIQAAGLQGLNPPSLTKPQAYLAWRGTVLRAGRSGDWEAARAELAATSQMEQAAAVEATQEVEVPEQQEPEGPLLAPSVGPREAPGLVDTSAGSRGAQAQPARNPLPSAGTSRQVVSKASSALPADAASREEAAAAGGRTPVTAVASPLPSPTSPVPSPPDALQQGQLAGAGAGSEPEGAAQQADGGHAAEASPGPRRHLHLGSPRKSEQLQHDRRSQTIDYADVPAMPAATPTEAGVHGEGQQMPRHERSTSGHSPRRDEVPDRRARRADAAAGREGSLSAERSSEKKRKRDVDVSQATGQRRQPEERDRVLRELGPPPAGPQGRHRRRRQNKRERKDAEGAEDTSPDKERHSQASHGDVQAHRRQRRSGPSPAKRTEGQQEQSRPLKGTVGAQPASGTQMQDQGQEPPDEALPPPPSRDRPGDNRVAVPTKQDDSRLAGSDSQRTREPQPQAGTAGRHDSKNDAAQPQLRKRKSGNTALEAGELCAGGTEAGSKPHGSSLHSQAHGEGPDAAAEIGPPKAEASKRPKARHRSRSRSRQRRSGRREHSRQSRERSTGRRAERAGPGSGRPEQHEDPQGGSRHLRRRSRSHDRHGQPDWRDRGHPSEWSDRRQPDFLREDMLSGRLPRGVNPAMLAAMAAMQRGQSQAFRGEERYLEPMERGWDGHNRDPMAGAVDRFDPPNGRVPSFGPRSSGFGGHPACDAPDFTPLHRDSSRHQHSRGYSPAGERGSPYADYGPPVPRFSYRQDPERYNSPARHQASATAGLPSFRVRMPGTRRLSNRDLRMPGRRM